jgi:uncharacterized protein (TIGR03435 family)
MLLGLTRVWLPLCASCCIFSQTAPPAFEAASIKLNTSGSGSGGSKGSQGQVVFTNVSLRRLVQRAYGIQDFELVGPDWMANVKFDIAAKYPPGESTNDQRNLMLQTLLAQQFHLTIHRETKEMSAYALVVAKNGPKLEASKEGGNSTNSNRGRFNDTAVSMAGLARQLADQLEHPVVDKTGLTGVYTLKLEWTPDEQPGSTAESTLGPSIFTALQDQLGLKLQTQKLPVEIIVVDRVDRTPVEN